MNTKRPKSLPAEVRANYRPRACFVAANPTPEKFPSRDSIFHMADEAVAALDPEQVGYFRGRAIAKGHKETKTSLFAVYDGKIIAATHKYAKFKGDALYSQDADRLRLEITAAAEWAGVEYLKGAVEERIAKVRGALAEAAHEAKTETKLMRKYAQIRETQERLAKLEAEATALREQLTEECLTDGMTVDEASEAATARLEAVA